MINSALINMLMASRLLYGMANERILPSVFGTVHPTRRTPWVSIVFTIATSGRRPGPRWWAPCCFLATPLSGRPSNQFLIAGILLGVGVLLWFVNYLMVGRVSFDPSHLDDSRDHPHDDRD